MNDVSKFIPMEENSESVGVNTTTECAGTTGNGGVGTGDSTFKVCGTSDNLPAKPTLWSKIKSVLFYEIKVELTPYQQKVENEINDFLHQEITWQNIKKFFLQEVRFVKKDKTPTNS